MKSIKKIAFKFVVDSDGHASVTIVGQRGDVRQITLLVKPLIAPIQHELQRMLKEHNDRVQKSKKNQ